MVANNVVLFFEVVLLFELL